MAYRDYPGPLAIAHRGGAGLAAENTLEAFSRSYALGVRYLETDVRCTTDGQLVAFHDAYLRRVTAASGRLRARSFAEISALQVHGAGQVVGLAELWAAFPDACFTLDVKERAVIEPLARLVSESRCAARVCVAAARGSWLRRLQFLVGDELSTALSWRALARFASLRPAPGYGSAAFAHFPCASVGCPCSGTTSSNGATAPGCGWWCGR